MNILRLSTLSLALAIAVFALTFANPSSAQGKNCDPEGDTRPKCTGDTGGGGGDGDGKVFLFISDDTCAAPGIEVENTGATETDGPSFGHVNWNTNVLFDPNHIHVHYKLQLKDVDPGTYQIFGNQKQACDAGISDFPLCGGEDDCNFVTVKQNEQGKTSGALRFRVCAPNLLTTVWVRVNVFVDGNPKVLHSPAVTMVLSPNEGGCESF